MASVRKMELPTGEYAYTPGGRIAIEVGLCRSSDYFVPGRTLDTVLEESATALKLRIGYVEDVLKPEKYLSPEFTEVAFATLDKTSGKVDESDAEKILELLEASDYAKSSDTFVNALIFAVNAAAINNPYAYEEIKKSKLLDESIGYGHAKTRTPFLYWMMVHELDYLEKLLKTSRDILMFNIDILPVKEFLSRYKENAIPTSVVSKLNEMSATFIALRGDSKKQLINIAQYITQKEGGNNAKLFVDWVEGWFKLAANASNSSYGIGFTGFAEKFYALLTAYGYDSKHLTDYLTRQSFYYGDFTFPSTQVIELFDYLRVGKESGIKTEAYPSHVKKAHNCIVNNRNAFVNLSFEASKAFSSVCAENAALYATKMGDYIVAFPKEPKDLFLEGATLNHCVGGYVSPVIQRQSIVAFLRKKDDPDTPLYTIEIKDGKVIQAKGNYNADVPPDIIALLHQIEKRWCMRATKALKKGEEEDD